jgi:hypothetical protein
MPNPKYGYKVYEGRSCNRRSSSVYSSTTVSAVCNFRNAAPPVRMNRINGHKLCGKRGGLPFFEAVRPIGVNATANNTLIC